MIRAFQCFCLGKSIFGIFLSDIDPDEKGFEKVEILQHPTAEIARKAKERIIQQPLIMLTRGTI